MNTRRFSIFFSLILTCLLWVGCDSKNPLSEPGQSKPDPRLAGVWRVKSDDGGVTYYHVGQPGEKLPESVMQVVYVEHNKQGQVHGPGVALMFPTVLDNAACLNVVNLDSATRPDKLKRLKENGWKAGQWEAYSIFKYRVEGDSLSLWGMNAAAKRQAITSGKIKGDGTGKDEMPRFTDTTENLARFVAAAGDSLFEKEPTRLERVK